MSIKYPKLEWKEVQLHPLHGFKTNLLPNKTLTIMNPNLLPESLTIIYNWQNEVSPRKFKWGICCGCHLSIKYGRELSYLRIFPGNKQAREGTAKFLIRHSSERSHLIFSNTVCVATLALYTAYLAPLALFPCRGVSRHINRRTVCNRSFDWASWISHWKRHFQTDPDVKFRKPNCCCTAPDCQKHVELRKMGIKEVSLSRAWFSVAKPAKQFW